MKDIQANTSYTAAYWFLADEMHQFIDYKSTDTLWIDIVRSPDPKNNILIHINYINNYVNELIINLEDIDEYELCRDVLNHRDKMISILESWHDILSSCT